ncbi:MAG: chlorophyll a/b-binding protein [Thermosynechococcaceae cyanobacterium]
MSDPSPEIPVTSEPTSEVPIASEPVPASPTEASSSIETPPQKETPEPTFGWSPYAEQINGRFAMVGFMALLILELITHQDFFTWIGLR